MQAEDTKQRKWIWQIITRQIYPKQIERGIENKIVNKTRGHTVPNRPNLTERKPHLNPWFTRVYPE